MLLDSDILIAKQSVGRAADLATAPPLSRDRPDARARAWRLRMPLIANRQLTVIFPEDAGRNDVVVKAGDDIYESIDAAEWVLRTFDSRTPYGPGCDDHCILALPPQRSARAPSARTSGGGARHTMLAAPSFTGIFKALEDNLTTEAAMLEPLDNSLRSHACCEGCRETTG